jgi:hypothetical protein
MASGEAPILARCTAIVNPLTRAQRVVPRLRSPLVWDRTNLDRQSLDSNTPECSSQPLASSLGSYFEHADTGGSGVRSTPSLFEEEP